MPERVAFWDIDGTLVSESMERHFLKYLVDRRRLNPFGILLRYARLALRWPRPKWYQVKLAYLRRKHESEVGQWIADCWRDVIQTRLNPTALEEIDTLKRDGYRQVLLSGTPRELALPLSVHLGINDLIAAMPEIIDHRYTGRLIAPHPHGTLKALYAERWCNEKHVDLAQTTAYGNHWGDRFLLERVGTPVAVNPDPQLLQHAQDQGWRIMTDSR